MMDNGSIVHVVDDDDSMRTAISRLLTVAGYETRSYASAGEFMMVRPEQRAGCIVLDVCMPGPNGLDLHDALRRQEQPLPVIFLTGHGDISMSVRAMKAGAVDFLTKPVERDALLGAVRNALERDAATRRTREQRRHLRARFDTLTPRERDVFARIVSGRLNKQIAADLGTAERTVKAHRAHVMEKMQAGSVAELVQVAEQLRVAQLGASRSPSEG